MLNLEYKDFTLEFKFDAGTSRGILKNHRIVVLRLLEDGHPTACGLGEAAPLTGLSMETVADLLRELERVSERIKRYALPQAEEEAYQLAAKLSGDHLPSLRFALETALLDLMHGGRRMVFHNGFCGGEVDIPINGLIWMGDARFLREQVEDKLLRGFRCIKMKIGAIDFEEELEQLTYIRNQSAGLIIRVDANGAFSPREVFERLHRLAPLGMHSIEQPILAGQREAMNMICKRSPVPVALDEELIGLSTRKDKETLLRFVKPGFIVLKPTLLGGFAQTREWIQVAADLGVGWWLTSALESNIGLNAIAQFAASMDLIGHQGLGTGQLYTNNFPSPLEVAGERLRYNVKKRWMVDLF